MLWLWFVAGGLWFARGWFFWAHENRNEWIPRMFGGAMLVGAVLMVLEMLRR